MHWMNNSIRYQDKMKYLITLKTLKALNTCCKDKTASICNKRADIKLTSEFTKRQLRVAIRLPGKALTHGSLAKVMMGCSGHWSRCKLKIIEKGWSIMEVEIDFKSIWWRLEWWVWDWLQRFAAGCEVLAFKKPWRLFWRYSFVSYGQQYQITPVVRN